MNEEDIDLQLRHNVADARYEAETAGEVAVCTYSRDNDTLTFTHVMVPPVIERRGVGTRLVLFALDDVRSQGLQMIPRCPFVLSVIRANLAYADLVAPHARRLVTRAQEGRA